MSGSEPEVSCTVLVSNPLDAVNISGGFTYKTELTPVITDVSPRRGGTAGGTTLTIQGSGFRCSRGARHGVSTHAQIRFQSLNINDSLPEHNYIVALLNKIFKFSLHPHDGKTSIHTLISIVNVQLIIMPQ